jgi:hypothetical protein
MPDELTLDLSFGAAKGAESPERNSLSSRIRPKQHIRDLQIWQKTRKKKPIQKTSSFAQE